MPGVTPTAVPVVHNVVMQHATVPGGRQARSTPTWDAVLATWIALGIGGFSLLAVASYPSLGVWVIVGVATVAVARAGRRMFAADAISLNQRLAAGQLSRTQTRHTR